MELNIKHRQDQLPVCLTASQLLCSTEVEQVLMICEDDDRVQVPFKVMAPLGECSDNSEQFPVKDLVITFGRVQGLREVTTGVISTIVISLKEYCSSSDEGSICCNSKLTGGIRVLEDWLVEEAIFQGQE
jgi:hypothetical protein